MVRLIINALFQPFDSFKYSFTTTKILICPGWETPVVPVSQPGTPVRDKRGCPFVPGLATGIKEDLGAASAHVAGAPFCPGWWSLFFHIFIFSILFLFQLYFCISIKLMYRNSVCKISTNIYIYIVTYIIFVLGSFHI